MIVLAVYLASVCLFMAVKSLPNWSKWPYFREIQIPNPLRLLPLDSTLLSPDTSGSLSRYSALRLFQSIAVAHLAACCGLSLALVLDWHTAHENSSNSSDLAIAFLGFGLGILDVAFLLASNRGVLPQGVMALGLQISALAYPVSLFFLYQHGEATAITTSEIGSRLSMHLAAVATWGLLCHAIDALNNPQGSPTSATRWPRNFGFVSWMVCLLACAIADTIANGPVHSWLLGIHAVFFVVPLHLVCRVIQHQHQTIESLRNELEKTSLEKADLTESIEQLQAEIEVLREKASNVATLAHEVRTPLNALLSCCTLLDDTCLTAEQAEYVSMMVTCGSQITNNIDFVLEAAKLDEGKVSLESKPFCPFRVCQEALQIVRHLAQRKRLQLRFLPTTSAQMVLGDPNRMKQALLNLLTNSIKFTHTGGITITSALSPHSPNSLSKSAATPRANASPYPISMATLRIEITDTGVGMSPEQQAKLFQPYVQASEEIYGTYGGSGLGLVITRQLIQLMGGTVLIDSERTAPGTGSTFVVSLDLPLSSVSCPSVASPERRRTTLFSNSESARAAPPPPPGSCPTTPSIPLQCSNPRPSTDGVTPDGSEDLPQTDSQAHQSDTMIEVPSLVRHQTPVKIPSLRTSAIREGINQVVSTRDPPLPSQVQITIEHAVSEPPSAPPSASLALNKASGRRNTLTAGLPPLGTQLAPLLTGRSYTTRSRASSRLSGGESCGAPQGTKGESNGFDDAHQEQRRNSQYMPLPPLPIIGSLAAGAPFLASTPSIEPPIMTSRSGGSALCNDKFAAFHVMLVDDNQMNNTLMARLFRSIGFTSILTANDGQQALELFAANPHLHLIVTDIHMPGALDGLGLAAHIRASTSSPSPSTISNSLNSAAATISIPTTHTDSSTLAQASVPSLIAHNATALFPESESYCSVVRNPDQEKADANTNSNGFHWPVIIALSGAEDSDLMERCFKAGIDAFLTKPVSRVRLAKVATRWLVDAHAL